MVLSVSVQAATATEEVQEFPKRKLQQWFGTGGFSFVGRSGSISFSRSRSSCSGG